MRKFLFPQLEIQVCSFKKGVTRPASGVLLDHPCWNCEDEEDFLQLLEVLVKLQPTSGQREGEKPPLPPPLKNGRGRGERGDKKRFCAPLRRGTLVSHILSFCRLFLRESFSDLLFRESGRKHFLSIFLWSTTNGLFSHTKVSASPRFPLPPKAPLGKNRNSQWV